MSDITTHDAATTTVPLLCGNGPSGRASPPVAAERRDLRDLISRSSSQRTADDVEQARAAITRLRLGGLTSEDQAAMAQIIADPLQPARLKSSAAAAVAAAADSDDGEATEESLLEGLRIAAADVAAGDVAATGLQDQLISTLGQVGSARALASLQDLERATAPGRASRTVSFAHRLVAFRSRDADAVRGLPEPEPAIARTGLDSSRRSVPISRAEPEKIQAVGEAVMGTYGIKLSTEIGLRYRCGDTDHMVLFNSAVQLGQLEGALRSEPMITALIVALEPESDGDGSVGYWLVQMVVMTTPTNDGINLSIYRPNGRVVAAGTGVSSSDGLELTLRERGDERAMVFIEGVISDDDISLEVNVGEGLRPKNPGLVEESLD